MSLTPWSILALVLAAAVGIVAQWSDSLLADLWWRSVLALVAIGLAYELYITRGLSLVAEWAGRAALFLGRQEAVVLRLSNPTRRTLTIEVVPTWPEGLEGAPTAHRVVVPALTEASTPLKARAVALGTFAWPAVPARVRGPLNLAWWSTRMRPGGAVRVVPDTLGPRESTVGLIAGSTAQTAIGSGHELHHLREYQHGDPRHRIDWKATARRTRLITRVLTEDQHLTVMVLVDAGRTSRTEIDGLQQFGHYANLAARFAEQGVANDDQVGLMVFADRTLRAVVPGRGAAAVQRIRAALTEIAPRSVESDVLAAALHMRDLVRHRCLVVILTDLYERSATSALAQTTRLLVPKHLPLIVGVKSDEVVDLSERQAVDWLDPYRAMAAREYQRQIAANVARLGQLGAYALTARARELDRKTLDTYARLRAQRRI